MWLEPGLEGWEMGTDSSLRGSRMRWVSRTAVPSWTAEGGASGNSLLSIFLSLHCHPQLSTPSAISRPDDINMRMLAFTTAFPTSPVLKRRVRIVMFPESQYAHIFHVQILGIFSEGMPFVSWTVTLSLNKWPRDFTTYLESPRYVPVNHLLWPSDRFFLFLCTVVLSFLTWPGAGISFTAQLHVGMCGARVGTASRRSFVFLRECVFKLPPRGGPMTPASFGPQRLLE